MDRSLVIVSLATCALLGACDKTSYGPGGSRCGTRTLLLTTSDFMRGQLAEVDLDEGAVRLGAHDNDDQDSAPAYAGCRPFVLQRGLGRVLVQREDDPLETLHVIDLDPPGTTDDVKYASNPVAVEAGEGSRVYVALAARNEIAIIDTALGEKVGAIDLSPFVSPTDPDGIVDTTAMVRVGDRLYVGLGRYSFDAEFKIHFAGSVIAVVDTRNDALVDLDATKDGTQGIPLLHANPWRGLGYDALGNRLIVGATGDTFMRDGALLAIDLEGYAVTTLLREDQLGTEIDGSLVTDHGIYVLTGNAVRRFNELTSELAAATIDNVTGMQLVGDTLVVWNDKQLRSIDLSLEQAEKRELAAFDLPVYGVEAAR